MKSGFLFAVVALAVSLFTPIAAAVTPEVAKANLDKIPPPIPS